MKKLILLILAALTVIACCACGDTADNGDNTDNGANTATNPSISTVATDSTASTGTAGDNGDDADIQKYEFDDFGLTEEPLKPDGTVAFEDHSDKDVFCTVYKVSGASDTENLKEYANKVFDETKKVAEDKKNLTCGDGKSDTHAEVTFDQVAESSDENGYSWCYKYDGKYYKVGVSLANESYDTDGYALKFTEE